MALGKKNILRRQKTDILSNLLKGYIKEMELEDGLLKVRIYQTWNLIVGERVSKATVAKSFYGGVLYCNINSSTLRTQLYYRKDDIIAQINKMLNEHVVSNIVMR